MFGVCSNCAGSQRNSDCVLYRNCTMGNEILCGATNVKFCKGARQSGLVETYSGWPAAARVFVVRGSSSIAPAKLFC